MPEVNDNKQLRQKIDELQRSVKTLHLESNKLYGERTSIEELQNALRRELRKLISQSKQARKERDELTAKVKEEKTKRSELSSQIKDKITTVTSLGKEAFAAGNLNYLKRAMTVINTKIETEVISFDKERALMKQLHVIEKEYAEAKKAAGLLKEKKESSAELSTLKKSADSVHGNIQENAKLSQEKHELVVAASKKIDDIKRKLDDLNKSLDEKDKLIDGINAKLEPLLKELGALSGKVRKSAEDVYHRRQDGMKKFLSDKRAAVEEKLKRGGKLTTEDVLVMQSGD